MSYIYANLSGGSCGWLWLRLRLCMWLWLGRLRHWYTTSPTQSVDHTLIVALHPPHLLHLGPHLPHLGLLLSSRLRRRSISASNATMCPTAESPPPIKPSEVRGREYVHHKDPVPNTEPFLLGPPTT